MTPAQKRDANDFAICQKMMDALLEYQKYAIQAKMRGLNIDLHTFKNGVGHGLSSHDISFSVNRFFKNTSRDVYRSSLSDKEVLQHFIKEKSNAKG